MGAVVVVVGAVVFVVEGADAFAVDVVGWVEVCAVVVGLRPWLPVEIGGTGILDVGKVSFAVLLWPGFFVSVETSGRDETSSVRESLSVLTTGFSMTGGTGGFEVGMEASELSGLEPLVEVGPGTGADNVVLAGTPVSVLWIDSAVVGG